MQTRKTSFLKTHKCDLQYSLPLDISGTNLKRRRGNC